MSVQPIPLVLKRSPEHWMLEDYLRENPEVVVVGLDWITEFKDRENKLRSFYHCSLEQCYNEQGTSRQMMQHLHRIHHLLGWLEVHGHQGGETWQKTVAKVMEAWKTGVSKGRIRVIYDTERRGMAEKARLRLTKQQIDNLILENQSGQCDELAGQSECLEVDSNEVTTHVEKLVDDTINTEEPNIADVQPSQEHVEAFVDAREASQASMQFVESSEPNIEAMQIRETFIKATSSEDVEKAEKDFVKKEEDLGPKDLLAVREDNDILVDLINKPSKPSKSPEWVLKDNVRKEVNKFLFNYYARTPDEMFDRLGNPKKIKIKTADEFSYYCKRFTDQFVKDIMESYKSFNGGSIEGIETANMGAYNIEHDIRKFFCRDEIAPRTPNELGHHLSGGARDQGDIDLFNCYD